MQKCEKCEKVVGMQVDNHGKVICCKDSGKDQEIEAFNNNTNNNNNTFMYPTVYNHLQGHPRNVHTCKTIRKVCMCMLENTKYKISSIFKKKKTLLLQTLNQT